MDKGREFEDVIAELYRRMGFYVEKRKLMPGRSGAAHEIDIYALGTGRRWAGEYHRVAVECKYKDKGAVVPKGELSEFIVKVDDLGFRERHFVTNSYYSDNSELSADAYNIELVDSEKLGHLLKKARINKKLEFVQKYKTNPLVKSIKKVMGKIR